MWVLEELTQPDYFLLKFYLFVQFFILLLPPNYERAGTGLRTNFSTIFLLRILFPVEPIFFSCWSYRIFFSYSEQKKIAFSCWVTGKKFLLKVQEKNISTVFFISFWIQQEIKNWSKLIIHNLQDSLKTDHN